MAENLEAAEPANILNDERARRLADRAALYAAGKNPYPERSSVTDHAADLLDRYEHPVSYTHLTLPTNSLV